MPALTNAEMRAALTDTQPCCAQCRFWQLMAQTHGNCRRYPPKMVTADDMSYESSPWTAATTWCGEFQPKPDAGAS